MCNHGLSSEQSGTIKLIFLSKEVESLSFATDISSLIDLFGRVFIVALFITSGIEKMLNFDSTIIYMEKYNIPEGKQLGLKLKKIEEQWIKNDFTVLDNEIEQIFKN